MASGEVENPEKTPSVAVAAGAKYHDKTETLDAFRSLTTAEVRSLMGYARVRMIAVRERVHSADCHDLFQEALVKTFSGTRRWRFGISFFDHLMGSMKSIANNWKKQGRYTELTDRSADSPSPDSILDTQALLDWIRDSLNNKPTALAVFDAWTAGHKPAETQRLLGLNDADYRSARRDVRRWTAIALERFKKGKTNE